MADGKLQVNKFTGCLVTDHHALDSVPNTTVDEDNVDLDRRGFRKRRKGLEVVGGTVIGAIEDYSTDYIKTYDWVNINNNGNVSFLIIQLGRDLSFVDKSAQDTTGELPFAIDLNDYAAPGVTPDEVAQTGIQVASGHGRLFVVGEKIEPFYVEYDAGDNDITVTQITLKIRDLKEQDNTLPNDARPSTITDARRYDLANQGWLGVPTYMYNTEPNTITVKNNSENETALDFYRRAREVYPPKTKPWWVGKRFGDKDHEYFVPDDTYDMVEGGNTLAALGHYIVEAFDIDRAGVSGITSLERETSTKRPTAVAFHAGRVFYGLGNTIYFSQVIEDDISVVNKCYQDADPTSENISDLVATDGGVLTISASGDAISLFSIENSVIFFSNNGVWAIGGTTPGSGFSATGFSVSKTANIGALSSRNIVNVNGLPAWWTDQGIVTIDPSQVKVGNYQVKSITDDKIKFYYISLSSLTKKNATGAFDHIQQRLIWLYNDSETQSDTENRFNYNRVLNYDTMYNGWFPYTVGDRSEAGKYLWDVFNIVTILSDNDEVLVVNSVGDQVINSASANVIVNRTVFSTDLAATSDVRYLVSGAP